MRTVGIYAPDDRNNLHRRKADEAYQVGAGMGPVEAYLHIEDIVRIAKENKATPSNTLSLPLSSSLFLSFPSIGTAHSPHPPGLHNTLGRIAY